MAQHMKTIVRYLMPEEAEVARLALDAEGIASYVEGEATVGWLWHMENAFGGAKLLVADEDVERALAILAKTPRQTDEGTEEETACPKCGAMLPYGFCVCWSCGESIDDAAPGEPPASANATMPTDEEEEAEEATAAGDAVAWRALAGAFIGLMVCPPLVNLYSLWVLLKLGVQDLPLSRKGQRNYIAALIVNLLVCCMAAWFFRSMFR
jgi:hypothetical protein